MSYLSPAADLYQEYKSHFQKIADIKYSIAVLQWDQETYMPSGGAGFRAQQVASLSELAHNLATDEKTGNLLSELSGRQDLSENQKKNIELSVYDFEREKKLPSLFVRTMSEKISKSYQSWIEARKNDSYKIFEPALDELIELKKEEADYLGYSKHRYDALLNDYERGITVAILDKVFESIQPPLLELVNKISKQPQVDDRFFDQSFSKTAQWDAGMKLIKALGFDFESGRQDISEHPFTTNFSSRDVRITTRIDEHNFANMLWSCIHETGHALYEQGLPETEYGLPLGEFASLSIHESQSRLWENNVGRSLSYWTAFLPDLKEQFPQQLGNVSTEQFYKGINKVQPSLIRTEADELTYHFHVIIRYEIEKQLIGGSLKAKDIPGCWNEMYKNYLALEVPGDKMGCLQDVHWSHGSFGYFPTYSLGSLYAAQFYDSAKKAIPGLEQNITKQQTGTLLDWLRTQIHYKGRKYTSEELCTSITGEPLNIQYFMDYAREKFLNIYNIPL